MKSFTSWSIRTHLLVFVALVILPSLGLIIHGEMQQQRDILQTAQRRMQTTAESVGLREEALVSNTRQILHAMAQLPGLEGFDKKRYQLLFHQILQQNPHLENIVFADAQGNVIIAANPGGPSNIGDRPYFQHVQTQHHPFAGGYMVARGSQRQVLPVAYPVNDHLGRPIGVLAAGIALEALKDPIPVETWVEDATLEILDHEGRLLYSSQGPPRFRGQQEAPAYMLHLRQGGRDASLRHLQNGEVFLHRVRRLDLNPDGQEAAWLRVIMPEKPLLQKARASLYRNLGLMGALTLALIALAWWIGASLIAGPIDRLIVVAQRMAQGAFTVKTGLAEGTNEVSRLARAFERLGVRLDIRERQLHKAKAESDEIAKRFQNLEQYSPDGVFWIRALSEDDYVYEDVNPAFERINCTRKSDMQGRRPGEVLPPEDAEGALAHYRQCMATGQPSTVQVSMRKGETQRTLEMQLIPLGSASGRIKHMVGFCRDITDARATEEAIRQSQKLKSLGILAGGIAHDFNNLLTAMLGNLNLAQIKLGENGPAANFLENIERTVLRASDLTRQLLAYSGRGHFVVKPLDLNTVVGEMTHLLEVSIPKKIGLDYRFAQHLPPIEADFAQIQQVVMNLVTNASDAIGDREGFISITTRCSEVSEGFISATFPDQAIEPGLFVILEVSDNGCGMSRKVLDHIFDPFFTTKSNGKGLGLSAMLGILRGHRAGIKIYSEVDRGTVFKLFFPAAKDAVLPLDYISPSLPIMAEGTILVVDDEPDIRETACIALETLGFTVLTAADGQEAVEVFQNYRNEIRAILMDLTMPRVDGKEAFHQIRSIDPRACVILSSGYSEQDIRHTFTGEGPAGFIQKPYHIKEMQRVLVDCLQLWAKA
ncbi:hybrid sensor histidine kinase/response regulator [Holophaga foetida]|uniref:hybrid sensor histidine kinase/response regulator n=1 Tax=Holophaga foetida TaxID=35839 RepID=UPI0002472EED|nr:PAS domain-containing protein [Holophaga foetida]